MRIAFAPNQYANYVAILRVALCGVRKCVHAYLAALGIKFTHTSTTRRVTLRTYLSAHVRMHSHANDVARDVYNLKLSLRFVSALLADIISLCDPTHTLLQRCFIYVMLRFFSFFLSLCRLILNRVPSCCAAVRDVYGSF